MKRRAFLLVSSLPALPSLAWAAGHEAPLIAAPKILEALSAKDVALDRPGQPARAGARKPREPAIDLQVQFAFDSAELLPQGQRQVDELALALNDKSLARYGFQLAGHTDRVGDADYNVKLSLARAEAVKAYLAAAHGLAVERLQTIGFGFARLADPSHPTAAVNRRVEVRRIERMPQAPSSTAVPGRLVPTPKGSDQ